MRTVSLDESLLSDCSLAAITPTKRMARRIVRGTCRYVLVTVEATDHRDCQNCVTCPPETRADTVIYRDTPMHIVVAGSR
jgi:hypothetical protein